MCTHFDQPKRLRLADQDAEHAVTVRQIADRPLRLLIDTYGDEALQFAVALIAVLYSLLRRPILSWGATGDEASSRLPGDEQLEDADGVSTPAITVDAPAASVWPCSSAADGAEPSSAAPPSSPRCSESVTHCGNVLLSRALFPPKSHGPMMV
jgi:hypothetical protein